MRRMGVVLGVCGFLAGSGACSDTSSPLTCGRGTAEVDRFCVPNGSGPSGDDAAGTGTEAQSGDGGRDDAGGIAGTRFTAAGLSDDMGGSNGDARGGSSSGEAAAGAAGSDAVAGPGANTCKTGRIDCASGVPFAASGMFTTAGSSDLVALDDTTILLGNHVDQALNLFDLCAGAAQKSWPLPSQPEDIEYDAHSNTAYVALRDQAAIAKVELGGADVTLIELPKPALMLATGNHGRVFARLKDGIPPKPGISIIDGPGANLLNTFYNSSLMSLMTYDRRADRLVEGSDSGLQTFSFDEANNELTTGEYNFNAGGSNCRQLVISPDQRHVVLTCGGGSRVTGSTGAYQVLDVDPANLQVFYGLYNIGEYPVAAAFSPGNQYLFAGGSQKVLVFDVATHAPIGSYSMRADQLAVSPSGRLLLSREGKANSSVVSWSQVKEPNDCK